MKKKINFKLLRDQQLTGQKKNSKMLQLPKFYHTSKINLHKLHNKNLIDDLWIYLNSDNFVLLEFLEFVLFVNLIRVIYYSLFL